MKKINIVISSLLILLFVSGCYGVISPFPNNPNEEHICVEHKSEWKIIGNPLCGDEYVEQIICTICNKVLDEKTVIKEHDYESVVTKEGTCEIAEEITYTCKECGHSYIETDPTAGHDYDYTVIKEATCEESGEKIYTCKNCSDTYSETILAIGHDYDSIVTKEATCEESGEITYTCKNCSDSYIETIQTNGHILGEAEIVTNPSGNLPGLKKYTCSKCGSIFTEEFYDSPYQANGKLSVNGPDLVNQYGDKYQLFGLSTHGLQWFSRVVNKETITAIHEGFGNNVIRFALYTDENGYCDGSETVKKNMLETLKRGIDIATELGLYVIVDWHMVGAENVLDKNPLTWLEESKEFFSYISEYYKDQDNILYEIMNEPNGSTTWEDCKKYANEVIPCIRKNTDAIILVGNPKWTADLNSVMADPLTGYTNIMYTYHFYAASHASTTQVSTAYDKGLPVFISEFGFMESSGDGNISETNGAKWKKVLDSRNISYVAWNISNSKGSASIFKYNTADLTDVSDSNLKEWGIYLKKWYSSKAFNTSNEDLGGGYDNTITKVDFELTIEESTDEYLEEPYFSCYIQTDGYSTSRLDYDWTSSDETVITISKYSTITIQGDGKCSIICRSKTSDAVGVLDIEIKNGELVNFTSRYTE